MCPLKENKKNLFAAHKLPFSRLVPKINKKKSQGCTEILSFWEKIVMIASSSLLKLQAQLLICSVFREEKERKKSQET